MVPSDFNLIYICFTVIYNVRVQENLPTIGFQRNSFPRSGRAATVGENKDIKNHDKFGESHEKHCDIGFQICMNTVAVVFDF